MTNPAMRKIRNSFLNMYDQAIIALLIFFVQIPELLGDETQVESGQQQCFCLPTKPGQPLVVHAQPAEQQNTGDDCLGKPECDFDNPYRYMDGRCNNRKYPTRGMTNHTIIRLQPALYSTNPQDPPGSIRRSAVDNQTPLPSARVVSNDFFTDHHFDATETLAFMVMSQLFTHDILSLKLRNASPNGCCVNNTQRVDPKNWEPGCLAIDIPSNDSFYSQFGVLCTEVFRAQTNDDFGCKLPEIEQANSVTSTFDGSVVYGASDDIAVQLRTLTDGKLKFEQTEDGRVFLPHMDQASVICFVQTNKDHCFKGPDFRANQHAQLQVMQVVMLRVHNKLVDEMRKLNKDNPEWQEDEKLYQETRKIVIAMLQHTIFGRFAELLFGPDCAEAYGFSERNWEGYFPGYDIEVNPGILAEVQHVGLRALHTVIKGNLGLYDENRIRQDSFNFSTWFNNPTFIKQEGILDKILIGLCTEPMEKFDRFYSTEITENLFKQFNQGRFGADLAAIDVERGRELAVQKYVRFARLADWPEVHKFSQLLDRIDQKMIERLEMLYDSVEDIDALIGAILEFPFGQSIVGKTLHAVLAEQFRRCKFGDSFYFSFNKHNQFTKEQLAVLRTSSLSFLICYGSDNIQRVQRDAYVYDKKNPPELVECSVIVEEFLQQLRTYWRYPPCDSHVNL